jgi:hypothetical protein
MAENNENLTTNAAAGNHNTQNVNVAGLPALTADVSDESRNFIATNAVHALGKFARTIAETEDVTEPFAVGVMRWYLDLTDEEVTLFSMIVDVATETGFIAVPDDDQPVADGS